MTITKEQFQTAIWVLLGIALVLLLFMLGPVLMPFVTGAILAYILNPLVDRLCRCTIGKRSLARSMAVLIAMVALIASILALALIVLPVVQNEIPLLQEQIPRFLDQMDAMFAPKLLDYGIHVKLDSAGIKQMLSEQLAGSGQKVTSGILESLKVGGTAVIGLVANVLLIPMVLYYLLLDWHAILNRMHLFIPRRWVNKTTDLVQETDDLLAQYLRGQLLVMFILAVYYSSALALAGFSVALPVGILTGLLVFIPYIGFGFGLCLALIGAVLQLDPLHGLLMVAIIYGIGQVVEGFYLTPRLVGERIGLPPLAVIFALLAFGQLFGFIGILLALPASAITSVALKHLRALYYRSRFYTAS
ncbi:AI-2E family transporter [Solimicrobium silvestre]|uniref:Putative permease n=1 Tax=Solimicrobium silvestre TaxID=2099400 RepID=A0A2S9GTH3_9BURK|nr:AI-2E family transporter [Solimicrobium silvestre]PRC91013.1 putative permease [Solimicrobium silvestre]